MVGIVCHPAFFGNIDQFQVDIHAGFANNSDKGNIMTIRFDADRWSGVKESHRRWWAGELDRPLMHYSLSGYETRRPEPVVSPCKYDSFHPPEHTAEAIVDGWDYRLSGQRFMGDSFPCVWPNFGPGVMAAFSGCRLENNPDTVWFSSSEEKAIQDIHVSFDPTSYWCRRVRDIMTAAEKRWRGQVQVGMTDLGGALDIIASFRGSELLLMDLYDFPSEVKRLTDETHHAWWSYFDLLDAAVRPTNPGYTAWTPILSETPYYMLQCDFAYMIGPEMFDEFVKPELAATCRKLKHAFYHLDGVGQLPHLDSLLSIPELVGIQWIPGAGQAHITEWPEVFRKIRAAGKLVQIYGYGDVNAMDALADKLGSLKGFICIDGFSREKEAEVEKLLQRFGAV